MASTSAASSSTPANSTQKWNYDVYICFSKEDTGKNFVDHLYAALHKRGIHTYLETETLPYGVPIVETLHEAIQQSRITVIVLSRDFAWSKRALVELQYILYCNDKMKQTIVPIYYDVEPIDLRNKKNAFFNIAFLVHELDDRPEVNTWVEALNRLSKLDDHVWQMKNIADGYEAEGIKVIVKNISDMLFPHKDLTETGTNLQDHKLITGGDPGYHDSKRIKTSGISSSLKTHPSTLANHRVFLSFHGEDTGRKFVDHLCSALEEHDILACREINLSDQLPLNSINAAEESRISIIIFSKNYVTTPICMDELAHIMRWRNEGGHIVIPLYYHVDPSYLQEDRDENYYGEDETAKALEALKEFWKSYESEAPLRVESWIDSLDDASSLNGWDIKSIADGYEAKSLQLIVKKISNMLFPDKDLIGLQSRIGDIKHGMISIPPSSHEDLKHLKIPLHEIVLATNNFSKKNFITTGGFGQVYRGESEKLGKIAVKKLDRRHNQGESEFMTEIAFLSAYKHENLVSLVGYCDQDDHKILVLKYEMNGSLDKYISSEDLTWIQRLRICLDAANGLKYLHEGVGVQHRILHRDVKSYNILLDETWKAKISDLGLSRLALANVPCSVIVSSTVCGTMGYIDPRYHADKTYTQKSDVYSFGVVLFEVLCSRLVDAKGLHFTAKLAQDHYENKRLDEIIKSGLRSQMNSDCLSIYSRIAYQCLKDNIDERPKMGMVVDQLEKALDYQQGTSGSWHDVYITFRHRDPECHVVDDVCAALHQGDVSTYKDEVTLPRNKSVLLKAIMRSRLFVIFFTKKFAVNSWYLDEVAKIIECMKEKRQLIFPVFLNVSRYDVREQKGYFGEVMSEFDRHPRMEVWKNALTEATTAPGVEYSNFRSSADFIKKIVEEIKIGLSAEFLSALQV